MALNVHAIECASSPTSAPTAVNQHWTNTTTGEQWFSNGTASIGNWVKLDADTDEKVGVSLNDSTPGYLIDKVVAGDNITKTEQNDGSNETLKLDAVDEKSKVSANDTTAGYLVDKVVAGAGITVTELNNAANETLEIKASGPALADEKVKVSSNDTTEGYLLDKIQAGTNITITENNDGFNETATISAVGDLTADCPAVQIRRTTDLAFTTSWVDVTFDTTDLENFPTILEHDPVNTDRILIKEDGLYKISYNYATEVTAYSLFHYQVRKNDAVIIPGSHSNRQNGGDIFPGEQTFTAELLAGDFISFRVRKDGGTASLVYETSLVVSKCAGAKGDKGDTGSGSSITVKDEGTVVTGGPYDTLNFTGGGVTVSNVGLGEAMVDIPSLTPVFGSQFQDVESLGESSTSSQTFQQKLSLTTGNLPSGRYRIGVSYRWSYGSTGYDFEARVQENNSIDIYDHMQEPKDSGTDQFHRACAFIYRNLSGVTTFDLDYRTDSGATAYIADARLEIWRVS